MKSFTVGCFETPSQAQNLFAGGLIMADALKLKTGDALIVLMSTALNNILRLNFRKKLALHCNNVYFCSQFEVDTYGNLRMTSVSGQCPQKEEAVTGSNVSFLDNRRGATNFVVLQNESK